MSKRKMGTQRPLNPKPVILVGTYLDGKPNFITVSWAGLTSENPPTMLIAIRNIRYSLKGIRENMTFSVNLPSADLVKEADYCGMFSGSETDKARDCNFKIFYGNLDTAPLIEQCPVNIECKVYQIIDLEDHSLIIGEIIETYISEEYFTNGVPDLKKLDPICICAFAPNTEGYYKIGDFLGTWGIGNELKKK